MAVVPPPRDSSRGKATAARPSAQPYPKTVVELFYAVVDDDKRTVNSIRILDRLTGILIIAICTGCALAYGIAAATKGFHFHNFSLPELIPGGVVGGGTLTYLVRRLRLRFRRRRGAAAKDARSTTEISLASNHTQALPGGTPTQ